MPAKDFDEVVALIRKEDARFETGAYHFVRLGLDHTIKQLKDDPGRESRHVTGQELLSGIRDYALEQYGPLAYMLLAHWGVKKCEDFGDIVFNLVDWGVLGKTDNDQPEDFQDGYDFREAFLRPFEPKRHRLN